MNLKKQLKHNLDKFSNDTVFRTRMATEDDPYLDAFTKALLNNRILMRGNDKSVHYESFLDIDFMGPEIKHPEWTQQLNRFYWLKYASIEYQKNKTDHMAVMAHDSIKAWMGYWPYYGNRTDIFEWMCCDLFHPMISTPLRLGAGQGHGWMGCLPYFFDHPLFDDDFVRKTVDSVLWQVEPMVHNNKYHSGEHNWRPNELSCLLFLSQVVPGLESHTEYSVEQLNDAFFSQYNSDGTHIEHTPDYHAWMTDIFAIAFILGHNRPELGISIDPKMILKALDYNLNCQAPDGRSFGIHDSYAWHPDNPVQGGRYLKIRDYIAKLTNKKSFTDEYKKKTAFCYPDAGQYFFINTGTGLDSKDKTCDIPAGKTKIFFDASKWGSWHTHQSKNALNLFHGNKMLLIDPGSLDYGNSADRWYGKLTAAHNTVNINNLAQSNMSSPLIREYASCDDIVILISDYTGGYQDWCGPNENRPDEIFFGNKNQLLAAHERCFIWVKGRFILVFDSINLHENEDLNIVSSHWQFIKGEVEFDRRAKEAHTCFEDYNVMIKNIYSNVECNAKIYHGDNEPMLGYNSRTGGKLSGVTPAPMLSIETETSEEFVRIAQIIIPYEGTGLPKINVSHEKTRYAMMFKIELDGERYDIASHYFNREFFKTNSPIREIGCYSSMARCFVKGFVNEKMILNWEYKNSKKK